MLELNLAGRTALVTGATGQLGRTIARTLAGCGANVAVHYLHNRQKADELVSELTGLGVKCVAVGGDVGRTEEVFAMRETVEAAIGAPQIVVACAVAQYQWVPVLDQPIEDYVSQFESCVLHSVNLAKAFLPAMIKEHYGRLIGINTECAMQCFPTQSAYAAAKRGMDGIYRVLAKEVGSFGVTVNQVAPGYTISDRDRQEHTEVKPDYDAKVPLGHRGTDQDIASAVAFLASDLAKFITGVYLPVCGGNVIPCI